MILVLYLINLLSVMKEVSALYNKPRQQEAKQMLALAESMMAAAVECGHLNLKEQEVTLMKAGSAALNLKLDGDEEQGSRSKRHRSTLNIREGWRRT